MSNVVDVGESARVEMTATSDASVRSVVTRRPRRSTESQARRDRWERVVAGSLGVMVALLLFGIWQVASTADFIDGRLYPSPSTIASRAWELTRDGELIEATRTTVSRITLGYLVGIALGAPLGALMGMVRMTRSAFELTLNALYVVPKLALLPVFITVFGLGNSSVIALIGWTVFFYVWLNTMEAFAAIPFGYREAGRSLDLSPLATFVHVLLPCALPQILVGLRVAMNVAVLVTIAAEFVVGSAGLGYLVNNARQLFNNGEMYTGIVAIAAVGVIMTGAVVWIGRRLTPWTRAKRSPTA